MTVDQGKGAADFWLGGEALYEGSVALLAGEPEHQLVGKEGSGPCGETCGHGAEQAMTRRRAADDDGRLSLQRRAESDTGWAEAVDEGGEEVGGKDVGWHRAVNALDQNPVRQAIATPRSVGREAMWPGLRRA